MTSTQSEKQEASMTEQQTSVKDKASTLKLSGVMPTITANDLGSGTET